MMEPTTRPAETLPKRRARSSRIGLVLCLALAMAMLVPGRGSATIGDRIELEVASTEAKFDEQLGQPVISLAVTEASKHDFAVFTMKNIGQRMALRVLGRVITTPVITEPVMDGKAQIISPGSMEDARLLASQLKSGAKLKAEIIPQKSI